LPVIEMSFTIPWRAKQDNATKRWGLLR